MMPRMFTAAELQAMTPEELDADAHRATVDRQRDALAALADGACSPQCLAATDRYGPCDCVCGDQYHSALWVIDEDGTTR